MFYIIVIVILFYILWHYSQPNNIPDFKDETHKDKKANMTKHDNSIIDITNESFENKISLKQEIFITNNEMEVPFWQKQYVYSYSEIHSATKKQINFYKYFRDKFMNNEYLDLEGNSNYAFILYFDLLNRYNKHKDIELLERQFQALGECCPKTKSYALSSLIQLLKRKGDDSSLSKVNNLQEPSYQYENGFSDYDPDAYKLGKKYKNKLELNKQETAWLNKFWHPYNVFISIEGCCVAIIKQYLKVMKELNLSLKKKGTSVAKEAAFFKEEIMKLHKKEYGSDWGYYNSSYLNNRAESEVYLAIFKSEVTP